MTLTPVLSGTTIAYTYVHDVDYPRNRLVRHHLVNAGAHVDVLTVADLGKANPLSASYIWRLSRTLAKYDLVFLSEFQLRYSLTTGIAARLAGIPVVVDGFVGRYETAVGDWGQVSPISLKALLYRAVDAVSLLVANQYLIDNEYRATSLRKGFLGRMSGRNIIALPVGAPAWARPAKDAANRADLPLQILYYGNYVPLHGLEIVLNGVAEFSRTQPIRLVLVGNGLTRGHFEEEAERLGIKTNCEFIDHVPEDDLQALISNADVVLGVFGQSPKAESVIANKVWQGLAAGKCVITRESPALNELHFVPSQQLLQVEPTAAGLCRALQRIAERKNAGMLHTFHETHVVLDEYVAERFGKFMNVIKNGAEA